VSRTKSIYEDFSRFFNRPTTDSLKQLISSGFGETDRLDFKEDWPSDGNLARHVLALANSGGGVVVVGVRQEEDGSFASVGMKKLRDKAKVSQGLSKFFSPAIDYELLDFPFTDSTYKDLNGKAFQVLLVESDAKRIPYQARIDGDGVSASAIYVRRGTESIAANHDELERLINARIESGYSSTSVLELQEHLEQLKTLYSAISANRMTSTAFSKLALALSMSTTGTMFESVPNPLYPSETYEQFISGLIPRKKRKIEQLLELSD
jgi:predicted HTH transcriptional regulator